MSPVCVCVCVCVGVSWYLADGTSTRTLGYADRKQLTWRRVSVVRAIHTLGLHVIHSSLEVVWMRDPLGYFLDTHTQPGEGVDTRTHPHTHTRTHTHL